MMITSGTQRYVVRVESQPANRQGSDQSHHNQQAPRPPTSTRSLMLMSGECWRVRKTVLFLLPQRRDMHAWTDEGVRFST